MRSEPISGVVVDMSELTSEAFAVIRIESIFPRTNSRPVKHSVTFSPLPALDLHQRRALVKSLYPHGGASESRDFRSDCNGPPHLQPRFQNNFRDTFGVNSAGRELIVTRRERLGEEPSDSSISLQVPSSSLIQSLPLITGRQRVPFPSSRLSVLFAVVAPCLAPRFQFNPGELFTGSAASSGFDPVQWR